MNIIHFQKKRASIESARASVRAEHERMALAAESGDKRAASTLESLRAELDGYDAKLQDLNAAETAAHRRAQEDARRDRAAEQRAARDDAATACKDAEQAARAAQDAIAALGAAVEAFLGARRRFSLAVRTLDVEVPQTENLNMLLAQQMVRSSLSLFEFAGQPSGVNRGTDLVAAVQYRNRRLLERVERAMQGDELPPAA